MYSTKYIYLRKRNMYKLQSVSPFARTHLHAAGLAGGSKPSSSYILYKSWHRASFMIFLPKF